MDKKYIEENEIEIRYLRNQLSDEELGEFEVYLMENPEALDELRATAILKENAGQITQPKSSSVSWLRALIRNRMVSSATAFGLGSIAVSLFPIDQPSKQAIEPAELVYLSQTRGISNNVDQRIRVVVGSQNSSSTYGHFVLVLDLPTGVAGSVDISVKSLQQTRPSSFVLTKQPSSELGTLTLLLNKGDFPPGRYEVKVLDSVRDSDPIAYYQFDTVER